MMNCKACGDEFDSDQRAEKLKRKGLKLQPGELNYCRECANELFRGKISSRPAKLYSSGSGCPLEPGDDNNPWGENNVRIMEGD
jgi:hypothetical protein